MSLISRLRSRAINATTRERRAYWTRAYLRAKAHAGRWDARMLNGCPNVTSAAVRRFIMRGVAAGLVVTATTNGRHASTSYHYAGKAADLGLRSSEVGSKRGRAKLVAFQRQEARHPERYVELFGPDNAACAKNGRRIVLAEGSGLETLHDNHVHGAPA